MFISSLPLLMIGSIALLLIRVQWPAWIGLALFFLLLPITKWVSSHNGETMKQMGIYKDQRIESTA